MENSHKTKKNVWAEEKKNKTRPITKLLKHTRQRLTGLAACLKRYTREIEARRINKLFSTEPSNMYSQQQRNKMRCGAEG